MEKSINPEFESYLANLRKRQLWVRSFTASVLFIAFVLALTTIGLLWEAAELYMKFIKKKPEYGLTGGANAGVELVTFVGLFVSGVFWGLEAGSRYTVPASRSPRTPLTQLALGSTIVDLMASILVFTLFVWACVDIDRARRVRHLKFVTGNQQRRPSADNDPIGDLPPPPPGMAYLVPVPGREGQPPVFMVPKSSSMYQNAVQPLELAQNGDPVELMGTPKTRELDGNAEIKEADNGKSQTREREDSTQQTESVGTLLSQAATAHADNSPA